MPIDDDGGSLSDCQISLMGYSSMNEDYKQQKRLQYSSTSYARISVLLIRSLSSRLSKIYINEAYIAGSYKTKSAAKSSENTREKST